MKRKPFNMNENPRTLNSIKFYGNAIQMTESYLKLIGNILHLQEPY